MLVLLGSVAFGSGGLEVGAQDLAGGPLITAFVVEGREREWHRVASDLKDGTETVLSPGTIVRLRAVAPGYLPAEADVALKRRTRAELVLAPVPWSADPPIERRVREAVERWASVENAPNGGFVRTQAADLAEQWLAWADETGADRALAEQVCRSVSAHPERCDG